MDSDLIPLHIWIRCGRKNAALASTAIVLGTAPQQNIAGHTPVGAPGVLHLVEVLATRRSIADCEDTVIERRTAGRRHHTARIQLERILVRLDGNRDGLLRDSIHQSCVRVRGNIRKRGHRGDDLRGLRRITGAVDSRVRIVGLRRDTAVVVDILECVVHQTAVAALVARGAGAIDELLLRKREQRTIREERGALEGARRGKRPAGAALALVFYGRNRALLSPVNGGGKRRITAPPEMCKIRAAVPQRLAREAARHVERLELGGREIGKLVDGHPPRAYTSIVRLHTLDVCLPNGLAIARLLHRGIILVILADPVPKTGRVTTERKCSNGGEDEGHRIPLIL